MSFVSFVKSCLILFNPMNCSMPGFPVLQYLPEFVQIHVHWVSDAIQPSHPVTPFSCPQSFPTSQSFPMNWSFTSDNQSIGVSTSASVLPVNSQGWFPLELTCLISLLSREISRVFSSTTIQKCKFFSTQPSLWAWFHICTGLLEKS